MPEHNEHYKKCKIEPWTIMEANFTHEEFVGYLKGNLVKYIMRCDKKGQLSDDIDKIVVYAKKLQEVVNGRREEI